MNTLQDVEIKIFEDDYEKLAIDFEKASALDIGDEFPENLITTATRFNGKYSDKSQLYEWSMTYLAIDKKTGDIIGTVQTMLKTVINPNKINSGEWSKSPSWFS